MLDLKIGEIDKYFILKNFPYHIFLLAEANVAHETVSQKIIRQFFQCQFSNTPLFSLVKKFALYRAYHQVCIM